MLWFEAYLWDYVLAMKNKMFFSEVLKQHFYRIFFQGVKSAVYKPLNAEAEAEGRKTIGSQAEGLYRWKALPHWQAPELLHCGSWNWSIIED